MRSMVIIPGGVEEYIPTDNQSLSHLPLREGSTTNTTAESNSNNFPIYLSMTVISIIILSGVTGNLLVFLAVKTTKKLQTISNVFIVNLSAVNLLFALCVLPFHIYTNFNKQFGLNPILCKTIAFVDYTLTGTAIMTITLIAYNRKKLVGDYHEYRRHFTPTRVGFMLAFVWILPMVFLLPPLLQIWGKFGYVERLATCNLHEDEHFFKYLVLILRTLAPSLLIIYFYICICRTSKASSSRLQKSTSSITSKRESINSRRAQNERYMTKMLTTIIVVFILSYFPCTITALIDLHHPLTKPYHLFCRLCIYLSSAINPVIYGLMNSQFNKAYHNLLGLKRKRSQKQNITINKIVKKPPISLKPVMHLPNSNLSHQFQKLSNVEIMADKIELLIS